MVVSIRLTCGYGETWCLCCCYFWLAVFSSSPFLSSMLGCLPVFVSFSHTKATKVHKSRHHYNRLRQSTAFSPAFFLQKPLMKIGPTSTSYSKRWPSATNLQHFHPPQQESRGLSVRLSPSGRFFNYIIFSSISVVVSSGEKAFPEIMVWKTLETLRACQDIPPSTWAPGLLQVKLGIGNQLMLVCDLPPFPSKQSCTKNLPPKSPACKP